MARIFVEITKEPENHVVESDWEVLFIIAPSLDDEKLHVAEEYESYRGNNMFALDYYATSDFPQEFQDELLATAKKEWGDFEWEITVLNDVPTPTWHYRAMETDYKGRRESDGRHHDIRGTNHAPLQVPIKATEQWSHQHVGCYALHPAEVQGR